MSDYESLPSLSGDVSSTGVTLTNPEEGEPSFFENLGGVTVMVGSNQATVKRLVKQQLDATTVSSYLAFTNVHPDLVDGKRRILPKATRIFYDYDHRQLIVKLVSIPHEAAARNIDMGFRQELSRMGFRRLPIIPRGSGRIKGHTCCKEADASYRPKLLPPGRDIKWPSVVVEVGVSETWRQLRADAAWWLNNSSGDVKVVILIGVSTSLPEIKFETVIADPASLTLALRNNRIRYRPLTRQSVVLSRQANQPAANITTVGATALIIRFNELCLRAPVAPEGDIRFSRQFLEDLADDVWDELGV
ncbi:hypothetical protein PENDEC_c003G02080 [Penicillium decumbens]|uniref:Uncharacterized protein n=1 Tax=Penicillium decumbens TaxID=69771 RepID=A0A1V6PJ78_PENDC|nr:hypothetical protein PENDEC_c003G02080 [Penicillium decumbens]